MKKLLITITLLVIAMFLLNSSFQVAAQDPDPEKDDAMAVSQKIVTKFEAIDVACPDGNIVLSEEPLLAGRSEVEALQEPGEKYFLVNATFFPTAYPNATLVTPGEGLDTPDGGFFVIHGGFGTGDLMGTKIFFTATLAEEVDDLPCEPAGPVAKLEGVILHQAKPEVVELDSALDENKFYTSHEAHSHLGTTDLALGAGTDIGPYEHSNLEIDRTGWPALNGAVYRNDFYTILNRRVPLDEDPPQPEARLARVNAPTGKVTLLGSPIDLNLGGLEISHCGEVFATGFSLINQLGGFYGDTNFYRVDIEDASLTLIGDTRLERIMDLAFDPEGTLWATVGNKLYTLDQETGSPTEIAAITDGEGVPLPIETNEIMGIAFTSGGELFGTTPWSDGLYSIDPESGAATEVGNTGFTVAHGGDIPMVPYDARCESD